MKLKLNQIACVKMTLLVRVVVTKLNATGILWYTVYIMGLSGQNLGNSCLLLYSSTEGIKYNKRLIRIRIQWILPCQAATLAWCCWVGLESHRISPHTGLLLLDCPEKSWSPYASYDDVVWQWSRAGFLKIEISRFCMDVWIILSFS